ncbi:microtubule-associated protein TORTIFOLIA1 [Tripterygium wilfordii]|uniref:Microtubule-associated protein TORTIFOLIA1 n=1 Tax=Tripterygium wilfordii TaxID=458696 RepID=A0A7J7C9M9_TRIWF|nr:microtubule-associated protein TORTIFOLIA1-like [Tripterygium wilfordii]KAF5730567.1 microtubule-associated protein TORTIFOLIA1 [Tripterygium wilfordii]
MSTPAVKPPKQAKPPNQNQQSSSTPARSSSSSLSSHLVMVELKQRILTSLSKLSDRDTHQIAITDLESIIQTLTPDAIPMLLNCLFETSLSDPKPYVKKESLRLLSLTCQLHADSTFSHLTKIIAHVVKKLKDPDTSVKDACRDAIGSLAKLYLKGEGGDNGGGSVVGLFVRPLFETMGDQNKVVQSGAAMCMAKMVEGAADPPRQAFQKLCPRICKLLNNQNFLAKASLLPVVASLSQAGAIAPQSMETFLQSIHECLGSADWATRKAAADALIAFALHSSKLVTDGGASTLTVLETCRFDKIKPVRESMQEALQLWKNISGNCEGAPDDKKASSHDGDLAEKTESSDSAGDRKTETSVKDSSTATSTSESASKERGGGIPDKAVVILKKKPPVLSDKELNPEFFQKLETRGSGDFPVEVAVPRRFLISSKDGDKLEDIHGSLNTKYCNTEKGIVGANSKQVEFDDILRDKWPDDRINAKDSRARVSDDDRTDINQQESSGNHAGFSKTDVQSESSFISNKGNWLAIQRQLLLLERQQAHLMNVLQDFMGGSHDSMVILENRVRGLERVVEDMARDLPVSSGRRGSNFAMGFEGSSNRPLGKYNGYPDYSNGKYNGRVPFGERFLQSDGTASSTRGRGPTWRSHVSDAWDFSAYGASRNGQVGSRRTLGGGPLEGRSPKSENDGDQGGSRRAWDNGVGPVRLGEGPSARSVWQASKDEATLEAIRVAGEDGGTSRTARVGIPEMTAEAMADDNIGQQRDPIWTSWSIAMDALQMGDMDTAYAEVISTGDDLLLVKLMDRSGPVVDQLSNEIANDVLHALGQFLVEQNLFDICLSWIQQLVEVVMENGPDVLGIPMELKKDILVNLHEASSEMEPPEDWEGAAPDQLLLQLATAWEIELQQF